MLAAWTGHRPDLFEDPAAAQAAVTTLARDLAHAQATLRFRCGGQRGVDTWAARAAIELGLPLSLIVPLDPAEFARDWSDDDKRVLELTLRKATEVRVVGGDPSLAYARRNQLLVADAELLVAVWTGVAGGGTAETIGYARDNGTPLREVLLPPAPGAALARGRGV